MWESDPWQLALWVTLSTQLSIFDPQFSPHRVHLVQVHFSKEGTGFWNHPELQSGQVEKGRAATCTAH